MKTATVQGNENGQQDPRAYLDTAKFLGIPEDSPATRGLARAFRAQAGRCLALIQRVNRDRRSQLARKLRLREWLDLVEEIDGALTLVAFVKEVNGVPTWIINHGRWGSSMIPKEMLLFAIRYMDRETAGRLDTPTAAHEIRSVLQRSWVMWKRIRDRARAESSCGAR